MSTTEPEYLETLSTDQRDKLFTFIDQADQIIGDHSFDRYDAWADAEIMALALRAARVLGYENKRLEELFRREFGISGVTKNEIGDWLAVIILVDAERRIQIAAGGRN